MSNEETPKKDSVAGGPLDPPRRDLLKGLGLAMSGAALGIGSKPVLACGLEALDPTKTPTYPRKYQWTLVDTRGIREFPGWRPGEPEIWGYTARMSYTEGEGVDLCVHTTCRTFDVRVAREGATPQVVLQKAGIKGESQPTPQDAAIRGCNWKPVLSIDTKGWRPGVYIVYLSAKDDAGKEAAGEHFFVVRHRKPGSVSKNCLILSTCTFTAYNDWGGANHYRSVREGIATDLLEPRLSLQRPWGRGFVVEPDDAPDVLEPTTPGPLAKPAYREVIWALRNDYSRHYVEGYANYASKFIRWAEQNGYVLEVATQHDLQEHPAMFADYHCLTFIGHDEYWSWEMRDTVERFVDQGGHLARFGGNFWCQVRLEDGGNTQVCYKDANADPVAQSANRNRTAIGWDDPLVNRPAAQTFGIHARGYSRYGATTPRSSGGFTVYRPWHWVFDNTDLYYGDDFGPAPINVFGFEVDGLDYRIEKGLPYPTGKDNPPEGIQILAMGLSVSGEPDRWNGTVPLNAPLDHSHSVTPVSPSAEVGAQTVGRMMAGMMTYFERGKGSVFAAGSCTWVRGLVMNDYFTQQITRNVLDRFA